MNLILFIFSYSVLIKYVQSTVTNGINHLETEEEPFFTTPIQNVTVSVGKEAILVCKVNHLNNYKVGWIRAGDHTVLSLQNRVITHNPRINIQSENNEIWKLKIRYLKESDTGCYMCQINTNIMKKQIGCIDVFVSPVIHDNETSTDTIVNEGLNVTLSCNASGKPSPRIQWKREDGRSFRAFNGVRIVEGKMFNQSTLKFVKITKKHFGAYLCIANNDIPPAVSKRILVNVNFGPKIKANNSRIAVHVGSNVQMECNVEAFPLPKMTWKKRYAAIAIDGNKYRQTETSVAYKSKLQLSVNKIEKADLGTYECIGSNGMGISRASIVLYEEIKVETSTMITTSQHSYNYTSTSNNIRIAQEADNKTTIIPTVADNNLKNHDSFKKIFEVKSTMSTIPDLEQRNTEVDNRELGQNDSNELDHEFENNRNAKTMYTYRNNCPPFVINNQRFSNFLLATLLFFVGY